MATSSSSSAGPGGQCRQRVGESSFLATVLLLVLASIAGAGGASAEQTATDWAEGPEIFPFRLGIPDDCADSSPRALNNGAFPGDLVVAGAANCFNGKYLPFLWKNGGWTPVELPKNSCCGGTPDSVSDDHPGDPALTLQVFGNSYNTGWVKLPGKPILELPPFQGRHRVTRTMISATGDHVVGGKPDNAGKLSSAVRWTRTAEGWSDPEEVGPGEGTSVTDDGSVIVGNEHFESFCFGSGGAWVWTETPDGGERIALDAAASALDVTHDGSMIVGCRIAPCTNNKPNCMYPIPVYWVIENGQWVMHDLQAIDNVDSVAQAVAIVADEPVIAGYGFTNQDGGILRPVVWLPDPDGSYGAPLRLEPIEGHFTSWAEAVDINRNGIVLGLSEDGLWDQEGPYIPTVSVLWNVSDDFRINAGLNDAWYNPATPGQGFFINVFPEINQMFVAWFTYDTERPDGVSAALGDPGHRWLTAFGPFSGSRAKLEFEMTTGGVFDATEPKPTQHPDGTLIVEFSGCSSGLIHYEIPSVGLQREIPIQRLSEDNVAACEVLAGSTAIAGTVQAAEQADAVAGMINRGLNDAWYNPATAGQGFFINVFPQLRKMFLAWFTFETGRPDGSVQAKLGDPGHRWLTAYGPYSDHRADLDIEVSTGGIFDAPTPQPLQHADGSIIVEMTDCSHGTVSYDIPSIGRRGSIPIQRLAPDNIPACEELSAQ